MTRISSRAACCAAAALFSLLTAGVSHAAPYYLAWGPNLYDDTATVSQFPHAMTLDSRGNVFVTGHAIVSSAKGFYTAKYDALDGHIVWARQLNGAGTNEFIANAIAVDSAGDCVVTGSRNVAGSIDYYTVKYSGVDGGLVWQKSFNGANDGEDDALKVVCDSANNAIVTGRSTGKNINGSTGFDWVTIKYKASDGTPLFMDSYTQSSSNLDDVPAALAVDSSNNIYVGGSVQSALNVPLFYLRKLKAADLTKLWDIVPIDLGADAGVTAMAVDANNSIIATGCNRDGANHFGYFTIKFSSVGVESWRADGPFSEDTFGFPRPAPTGVAIGADNNPIVTGTLFNSSGDRVIRTIKYTSGGFFGGAVPFWDPAVGVDTGLGFGDTSGRAISADSAGNAIVVGDTENEDGDTDLYIAKYDSLTGARVQGFVVPGSFGTDDKGVDVAVDQFGNISALGLLFADKGTGIGLSEFATVKLNRFIAPTGEDLPDGFTGIADTAQVTTAGPPAISTSGVLATKLTFKAGKNLGNAILVEGTAAGGPTFPAVKGQPAPVGVGEPAANWASFSDPIVAPNGNYAFAAKVSGSAKTANGVWADLNGTLKLVLRQGSIPPVAGLTDKVASVTNLDLSSNALIALVKLTGPAASNVAIIRVDNANNGALLLRTGKTDFKIDNTNTDYTIKGITLFSPAKSEAGDGRWQGAAGVVARVSVVKTSDPKSKATAIVSIANGNSMNVYFSTGQTAAAPVPSATYSGFGFPSTATGTQRFTVKATVTPASKANNSALIFSSTGAAFNAYALKGVATDVIGLPSAVTYGDFSDPIVNTNSQVAFIATLKGSAADVKSTSNKSIVFGSPTGFLLNIARTGDFAPDTAGDASTLKWTAFTALALPGGTNSGPIFVGKLNTAKNNIGLWARDSSGKVRLLIRAGDKLGSQTVKKIAILTAVSKATSAPRSFDTAGSVAVALSFTDGKTALLRIGIP